MVAEGVVLVVLVLPAVGEAMTPLHPVVARHRRHEARYRPLVLLVGGPCSRMAGRATDFPDTECVGNLA